MYGLRQCFFPSLFIAERTEAPQDARHIGQARLAILKRYGIHALKDGAHTDATAVNPAGQDRFQPIAEPVSRRRCGKGKAHFMAERTPCPSVSVITPVWNAADTLEATVRSVQAQTWTDWEMLLIDDGSEDGSRILAERLGREDPRIRILGWSGNRGAATARNAGIAAAKGRYVAFLDADDLWRPEKLAAQLDYIARTGAVFVFSAYRRMDANGRPLGRVGVPARVDHARLLRGNVIGCLTAMYDAAHYGPARMPNLRRRQDYGLWLRLLARGGEAHGINEVLADYRVRRSSLSANKITALAATWQLYREVVGLERMPAAWYLASNAAGALCRRIGKQEKPDH
jgi:teichuronic acid biosynthesis glycosyltransferase TuaG